MGAPQYEQAGADIAGGGTQNYVAKWTTGTTLGNSVITDNGTTIGLGSVLNVTAATGALSTTGGAITWALATGTSALNIASNLLNLDTTNTRVGVNTASPNAVLSVYHSTTPTISVWNSSNYTRLSTNVNDFYFDVGLGGTAGATVFRRSSSATESMRIDANGNIYGTSGTTGMTNGFFYIPGAAGAPTGTPTAVSGRVPMYYDTTNNKFYVYNGAWKAVTLA